MVYEKWMRYNEQTNALDYLEKCYHFLKTVENERQNWKWVIITMHNALYGFAISACRGSNSESVIRKTKNGHERLIDFDEALKRCQDPDWMRANINYSYYELSNQQKKSIRRLHNVFRNNFEHFTPKFWSIEIHDMPIMILDCLDVVNNLIVYSDVGWRLKISKLRKAKSIIYNSKKTIRNSLLYKETLVLINKT